MTEYRIMKEAGIPGPATGECPERQHIRKPAAISGTRPNAGPVVSLALDHRLIAATPPGSSRDVLG